MKKLADRPEAGRLLADQLMQYANQKDVIVLALPRGGVPVAFEISKALKAPLDVFLVRKLGVPDQPELAMGAIAMGGTKVFNESIVNSLALSPSIIESVIEAETHELQRRNEVYRQNRPIPDLKNKTVILVDDGLATGATMRAAVLAIKKMYPKILIVAVPVSAYDTYLEFQKLVDQIICLYTPEPFYSIGLWYDDFNQTADEEVLMLLAEASYHTKK